MSNDDQTIAAIGEFGLIDRVTRSIGSSEYVLLGPGDDAAHVATADGTFVVSTDILIEGRHFRRDWSSALDIGHKAAAANLSDINAMGGVATALTMAFAAPADLPAQWADDMVVGFETECATVGAHLVGGDVSAADQVVISVTAFGDAERPVTRGGARAGDVVAYAGTLGLSAAGYAALSRGFRSPKVAVDGHRRPSPPYAAGPAAAAAGATSMIDVSDGLLADLEHISRSSGVAIDIQAERLDIPEAVATLASALGGLDPLGFVLGGGEDFALVATFPGDAKVPAGWTVIGAAFAGEGVTVDGEPYTGSTGHRHFA
ncbi:thiamine-phosphate kinase [Aeromicrobium sp. YIM 150415]|uniref:thiamine-phosphate kinase n=1 Tax=Aeromicrobium sp. YIM 150415 TaxID=2803912 RepID=UPI0019630F16|nr:thiamine-phosphate kinase [Aeromicrobium sp. YIM 150415]MBM9461826.1 thiamine-phosphate kinase [Aeromicrobium sp. YIM 150415]MBM9463174.1 thiamine-phosphate kinase [Aeromicrobium sp. YIM 150415]